MQKLLLAWYSRQKRDLPWRVRRGYPNPYHVLVSELMLQQTQVATVIPYFRRFIERFPTMEDLAGADEQEILRLWQGLGYYSRARNLHRAAKAILAQHGGAVPKAVDELMDLPGIGRYTAGAVASLAHGTRAPILDGNVQRVLCRLDALQGNPADPETRSHLWARAEQILPKRRVADFNSAMMELGAMVCTPRNPQCLSCPVRSHCRAAEKGIQERIPPARRPVERPLERRWVFCIEHCGRWLIEQRPANGRWAGMWQFITLPRGKGKPDPSQLADVAAGPARPLGEVTHDLTHRRYRFEAFRCKSGTPAAVKGHRVWVTLAELQAYPLPKPHLRIAEMLRVDGLSQ